MTFPPWLGAEPWRWRTGLPLRNVSPVPLPQTSTDDRPMPITPHEALQRVIVHREIFFDEMVELMRQVMRGEVSPTMTARSEEHTSELQSQSNLVCRLLLEK